MAGWGKLVAGTVIGIAGTVYATNEEVRKQLPKAARDLPDAVRRRFESAVTAAREASTSRREEILRDLETHGGDHPPRVEGAETEVEPQRVRGPLHDDDTQQLYRPVKEQG